MYGVRLPNPASMTGEERAAYRNISLPGYYTEQETLADGSMIATGENVLNGRAFFYLTTFAGKALRKDIHAYYRTREQRDQAASDFCKGREQTATFRAEMRAERSKPHSLKVGDILSSLWGWEQTNVDFYQVIALTTHTVTVRKIAMDMTESGWLQGEATPRVGDFVGEPTKHKANSTNSISISSYSSASLWDGKPEHWTAYA